MPCRLPGDGGTFFVDENDLALGEALAKLHGNVRFPGHPDLPAVPSHSLLENHWANMATIIELNPVGQWMYAITEAGARDRPYLTLVGSTRGRRPTSVPCAISRAARVMR